MPLFKALESKSLVFPPLLQDLDLLSWCQLIEAFEKSTRFSYNRKQEENYCLLKYRIGQAAISISLNHVRKQEISEVDRTMACAKN